MEIYISIRFQEIPFSSYLVMARDGRTDGRTERRIDGK